MSKNPASRRILTALGATYLLTALASAQGATEPPVLETTSISSVGNYVLVPRNVDVTGSGLDTVDTVTLGSQQVAIISQSAESLTFRIEQGHEIGDLHLVASNSAGSSNALPFQVTGKHPSVLVAPFLVPRGSTGNYQTFTDAGWTALYLVSGALGPTALPGIVEFEIGGGSFANLIVLAGAQADAGGVANIQVTMPANLIPPITFHFEVLTIDPSVPLGQQTPLETSNKASVTVAF